MVFVAGIPGIGLLLAAWDLARHHSPRLGLGIVVLGLAIILLSPPPRR